MINCNNLVLKIIPITRIGVFDDVYILFDGMNVYKIVSNNLNSNPLTMAANGSVNSQDNNILPIIL